MIQDKLPIISVDIDKDRIREIVAEALRMMREYLQEDFGRTDAQVLADLEMIIGSNKVSTYFFLSIGSTKIPDLVLRVDPVRKEVLCKSAFRKKVARVNHFIKAL
jgi:hypothetical protein